MLLHLLVLHLILVLLRKRPARKELPSLLPEVIDHACTPCSAACPEPFIEPPSLCSTCIWLEKCLSVELHEVSVAERAEVLDFLVQQVPLN